MSGGSPMSVSTHDGRGSVRHSQKYRPGHTYPNNHHGQGHLRTSNAAAAGHNGGSFNPNGYASGGRAAVGTCTTTFGVGTGGRGNACCNTKNGASSAGGKGTGCTSPEGCRCINLDDPQKVFKLVLQAIRHIGDGEGATPAEIHCYMRKHHRLPDDEDKLMQIVKDSLKRGICIGCLRRRYCDGKYYISEKTSGRPKRKPVVAREASGGKKSNKKVVRKPLKKKLVAKGAQKKKGPRTKQKIARKGGSIKKTKSKKKGPPPKKSSKKCPPKKIKRKFPKMKGKPKCAKPKAKMGKVKPRARPGRPADDAVKKIRCAMNPDLDTPGELKIRKLDYIWANIPEPRW